MRVSLKKFTRDPYKYAKKAPLIILLGDDPAYALINYSEYKELTGNKTTDNQPQVEMIRTETQVETRKPRGWLYNLLFA